MTVVNNIHKENKRNNNKNKYKHINKMGKEFELTTII